LENSKNILICPLEWGLGHAARMIPLAKKLCELNNNVFVASGEKHLDLFRAETTGITLIGFPGFSPTYSRHLPQYLAMLLRTPLLLYHIIREHQELKTLISRYNIDIVISDNRFGLWNSKAKTVYVTHLPRIPLPKPFRLLEWTGVLLHRAVIRKYDYCFIPDLPGELNLSGRLSHEIMIPGKVKYIGILSRFSDTKPSEIHFNYPHNTVILSGPEPQRGILKKKLEERLSGEETDTVFLEGKPGLMTEAKRSGHLIYYNHLPAAAMRELLTSSTCIISRSGYTTVMDLAAIGCSALLIPTPGQTEQEYLAEYLSGKGLFQTTTQDKIKDVRLTDTRKIGGSEEIIKQSEVLLSAALSDLLEEEVQKDNS
jgi:spore coat polysaccharide biosynthesis predicted glycosyltransferase SpsG